VIFLLHVLLHLDLLSCHRYAATAMHAIIHHGRLGKGVPSITEPFSFTELAAKVHDVPDAPQESLKYTRVASTATLTT
jgi:hypothetical protein